jgi:hypothetical protein
VEDRPGGIVKLVPTPLQVAWPRGDLQDG